MTAHRSSTGSPATLRLGRVASIAMAPAYRAGADPLAALERGAEDREVQRHPLDPEPAGLAQRRHDHQLVEPGVGGAVPAHQVQGESVLAPRHEVEHRADLAVLD